MQLSIRSKLIAANVLKVLLMAILGLFAVYQMSSINERANFIGNNIMPALKDVSEARRIINRYRALQNGYLAFDDAVNRQRIKDEMNVLEREMEAFFRSYRPRITEDAERDFFEQIQQQWPTFVQGTRDRLMPAVDRDNRSDAQGYLSETLSTFQSLYGLAAELSVEKDRQAAAAVNSASDTYVSARTLALTLTVAMVVTAAAVAALLSTSIAGNVGRLTTATVAVAQGDLTREVQVHSRDELGTLATTFNQMVVNLRASQVAERQARETETELREAETQSRRHLEQTVAHYLQFTQQVAQGDLTQRLQISGTGAMAQLGQGLNTMVASLHTITGQVQQANSAIAAAAAEILAATTQQAASASEQSAAITQTSTTIEEVKVIAQQTAHQAAQVAHDSEAMLQVARQGTQAVEETVSGMQDIRVRVSSIAETILALAEQTQAISAIITTVSELADQSNLLALNAAIEAARAGEQGKSFAVVAQHVRELAERSKAATVQIRDILGEIQRASNTAVLVTEEGTKGVEAGAQLAGQAGQVIHRIAGEVESGAQANVQMAAAAGQQTAGIEQIGQAMGSIQQATTQALASTRQAERAAQELHSLSQSLQHAIAVYRL